MKTEKDILEKIGKASYGVPEGYFSDLASRLEAIPERKTVSPGVWMRVRPYAALAACFAAILLVGTAVLRRTAPDRMSPDQLYNEIVYADMVSGSHPEAFLGAMEYEQEDISEDDIINHLIESGVQMEYIAYAGDQK